MESNLVVVRTIYGTWSQCVRIMNKAKKEKLYSHWTLVELTDAEAKSVLKERLQQYHELGKIEFVKDIFQKKSGDDFLKSPAKLTAFYEKDA